MEIEIGARVWHRRMAQYGTVTGTVSRYQRDGQPALAVRFDGNGSDLPIACFQASLEVVPDPGVR